MAEVGCSPNAAIAMSFLMRRGLRDYQAAAVVGNLQQESFRDLQYWLEVREPKTGDIARGIAMWGPPRWNDLLTFAYSSGFDPKSLEGQIEFLWHELETQPSLGLRELADTTTLEQAVVVFQDRFERPDSTLAATGTRIANARRVLQFCPLVDPPTGRKPVGLVAASIGLLSLVSAAAYGAYKALRAL